MKNWLFDNISDTGENLIHGFQLIATGLLSLVAFVSNNLIRATANLFKITLWFIDSQRVDHAEHVVEQMSLNNELQILMNVTRVKEDALERRAWTNNHSLALNELSSKLYTECEWDKERIHDYMRSIVESIPGLSYVAGEDDEDDEDSIYLDD